MCLVLKLYEPNLNHRIEECVNLLIYYLVYDDTEMFVFLNSLYM